jgi:hypothetical protein
MFVQKHSHLGVRSHMHCLLKDQCNHGHNGRPQERHHRVLSLPSVLISQAICMGSQIRNSKNDKCNLRSPKCQRLTMWDYTLAMNHTHNTQMPYHHMLRRRTFAPHGRQLNDNCPQYSLRQRHRISPLSHSLSRNIGSILDSGSMLVDGPNIKFMKSSNKQGSVPRWEYLSITHLLAMGSCRITSPPHRIQR